MILAPIANVIVVVQGVGLMFGCKVAVLLSIIVGHLSGDYGIV